MLKSKIKNEENNNNDMNDINNNLDKLIEGETDKNKKELIQKEYNVNNYYDYDEEDNQDYSGNALKNLLLFNDYFLIINNTYFIKLIKKNKKISLLK